MAFDCDCRGGSSAGDCDNCRQTNGCNKKRICDICGEECYEKYYEFDNDEVCEECVKDYIDENYRRSVDF